MSSKIDINGHHESQVVKAIRLKDWLTEKVDFLKIDIEGAEYEVIKDIRDKLHLVDNLFLEYHGSFEQSKELADIFYWLNEQDFCFYIKEAAPVYDTPFLRKRKEGLAYDVQLNIFCFRKKQSDIIGPAQTFPS